MCCQRVFVGNAYASPTDGEMGVNRRESPQRITRVVRGFRGM